MTLQAIQTKLFPRVKQTLFRIVFVGLAIGWSATCPQGTSAQSGDEVSYNLLELPSSRLAINTLSREATFLWHEEPLRDGLQGLSTTHSISIWLDRRIDPNQRIDFRVVATDRDRSLGTSLNKIAVQVGAQSALIENVVYIGPASEAARVQLAAVRLHDALSRMSGKGDAEMRSFEWRELATPQSLVDQLSAEWSVPVNGDLPHDLMHSGRLLAPSTLATQVSLLAAGFEQQGTLVDGSRIELEPLGDRVQWSCNYQSRSLNPSSITRPALAKLKRRYPGSAVSSSNDLITVHGNTAFHLALLRPSPRPPKRLAEILRQPWGFDVKNKPVELVLESMSASIGFELTWGARCELKDRQRIISFQVDRATLDELLQVVSEASQLKISRDQLQVSVDVKR